MNVLTSDKKSTIKTLLKQGVSQHEIHRKTGLDRKTIRNYAKQVGRISETGSDSKSSTPEEVATGFLTPEIQNPPPWPPAHDEPGHRVEVVSTLSGSACELYREWIEKQVALGRNAVSIYQDLVDQFDFTHKYNSVKRFVGALKGRNPEQFDHLEFDPGEEAQVDYGQGAKTRDSKGKYSKPRLFVMTLKYSGRSFRKVVWKSSQEIWARLHEEAFRYFGGCTQYVVLDNLKEGVIKPDIYEPDLNPVYAAVLDHYGVVADTARVGDPNRKGSVENAIKHTQSTALKGRTFERIEEQNVWLMHWEEKWAALRIHGRAKRQVEVMFQEEKPYLLGLPLTGFRYFKQECRTVYDDGLILVDKSYYAAMPAPLHQEVIVRIYVDEIEIIDPKTLHPIRRHPRSYQPGSVDMAPQDRIFNPSRQSDYLLGKAEQIGMDTRKLCERFFREEGRVGQRRMQGVVHLARRYEARHIEQAAAIANQQGLQSLKSIRKLVEHTAQKGVRRANADISQDHVLIRPPEDYGAFFDRHAAVNYSAKLSQEELRMVWQNANWHKVIEVFGLQMDTDRRARPEEIWIKSPFTDEKTASLHLNLPQNVYKDFSGQTGGGILNFCQELLKHRGQSMNCYEVGAFMIEKGISALARIDKRENKGIRIDLRRFLRSDHPELIRRGVDQATCKYLGCGFLEQSDSPLGGRLVFQVRGVMCEGEDLKPIILTHAGRALSAQQAQADGKYWSYPFHKRLEIYNQDNLILDQRAGEQLTAYGLILVEGFFDVAALVGAGCLNVGAIMGTELSGAQIERLKYIQTLHRIPKITLFFDRDPAGMTGSGKAAAKLRESGFKVAEFDWNQAFQRADGSLVNIPDAIEDPGDMSAKQLQWLHKNKKI